jgi:thymidylate synthase
MFISRDTLDDVLLDLYPALLQRSKETVAATRGETAEIIGVLIEIKQPRARLSRSETRGKLYSSLGELLWYLSRSNRLDFIEKYVSRYKDESEDGVEVYGGYGPRLFGQRGNNQVRNVIELLRDRPTTRRAVIQIFNAEDIAAHHTEIPCTTTFQFFVRNEYLDMVTTMRSNDAYLGLPHDVFCFTMLQEIIARALGRETGIYRHFAGSLHLYKDRWVDAQNFVNEAYQQRIPMPEMPVGDPWPSIEIVLRAEDRIRKGEQVDAGSFGVADYWSDLIRIVQIHFAAGNAKKIEHLAGAMSFREYRPYIIGRLRAVREE